MFKSKTKYRWEGWESSGQESWVFSVKHPCELMGVHAKLIDSELKESEPVQSCVYAPRVSATSTPFGLASDESSCGLCVTDRRFIISKDRHVKGAELVLTSVDFKDIVYLHIGSALLLSWFSVSYIQSGKIETATVIFGSNGKHHFEKAIRVFKGYCGAVDTEEIGLATYPAGSFLYRIKDSIHRNYLKTLISANEKCVLTLGCYSVWDRIVRKNLLSRKEKVSYPTSKATILVTDKSVMVARNSLEFSVGNNVDVLVIPLDKVFVVSATDEKRDIGTVHELKLNFSETGNNALHISLLSLDEDIESFTNNVRRLVSK